MSLNYYNHFRTSERSPVDGPLILRKADHGSVLCEAGGHVKVTVDWHSMCFMNQICQSLIYFVPSQSSKVDSLEVPFCQITKSFYLKSYYRIECSFSIDVENLKSSFSVVTTVYSGLVIFCHLRMPLFLAS